MGDVLSFRPRPEQPPVDVELDDSKEPISLDQERIRRRIGLTGIEHGFDGDGA